MFSRQAITVAIAICADLAAPGGLVAQSPAAKNKLAVALSIKKINFGKVAAGTRSTPQIVTLTNKSKVEMSAPAVIVSGAGFSLNSNGCTGAILPAASCPVGVTFTPPKIGKFKNGLLKFSDAAAKSPQKVKLIGVGATRAVAHCDPDANAHHYCIGHADLKPECDRHLDWRLDFDRDRDRDCLDCHFNVNRIPPLQRTTSTLSATATMTASHTATSTASPTQTAKESPTPTRTQTATTTPTASATSSSTGSQSITPTATATASGTGSATITPTATLTSTAGAICNCYAHANADCVRVVVRHRDLDSDCDFDLDRHFTPTPTATSTVTPTPTATSTAVFNVAFVTSTTSNGDLGGQPGADAECASLAAAASLPSATYKAWLSTSTLNAAAKLGTARGFVRPDGQPFADQVSDIAAGNILNPLILDESGNNLAHQIVWTGTTDAGIASPFACGDWLDRHGRVVRRAW